MTITCLPIDASGGTPAYTAQQTRNGFAGLWANGTARPLGSQSGFAGGPPTITATSTTWSVPAATYVVDAAFTTTQSPYFIANDATVTGAVTAANASNPRVDILYLQVNDTAIDSSGSRNATISYLAGTAAPSPVAPTLPARSLLLATINVPTSGGGSPAVTINPQFAVATGGLLPIATTAARSALITNPYDGFPIYRTDTNRIEIYNGTTWDTYSSTRRCGVTANFAQSFTTDSSTTSPATNWSWVGDTDNYQGGAITTTTTPITVPAGLGGLHALSLSVQQTGTAATGRSFWQIQIGGTMSPANLRSIYRVPIPVGENDAAVSCEIPLSAGQTVAAGFWFVNGGSTKSLSGTLSCYRVGD